MAAVLALPLAPAIGAQAVSAGTLILGSGAYLAQQAYGFRRPLPPIPRIGGKAGGATLTELINDAVAGARVGVAHMFPPPWTPPPFLQAARLVIKALLAQLWGLVNKRRTGILKPASTGEWAAYGDYSGTVNQYMTVSDRIWCSTGLLKEKGWVNNTMAGMGATKSYGFKYVLANVANTAVCSGAGGPGSLVSKPWLIYYKRTSPSGAWVEAGRNDIEEGNYVNGLGWTSQIQVQPFVVKLSLNGAELVLPTIGVLPDRDAVPESVPQLPPLITPITPVAPPAVEPEVQPEIAPVEPGPVRPPTTTPALPPVRLPVAPANPTGIKDGAIVPKPADPVTVTNPDWHFPIPGKGPIVGNGPRPVPEEMAKELGRLEQKLNSILNPVDSPVDWLRWLEMIREALFNLVNGTTYTLTEECNPDGNPNYQPRSWDFQAPGALNAFGVLENRIDALAAMVDQSLRAKQQICPPTRPRPTGELVTARFRSTAPSPNSSRALRKELRYRDSAGRPEAEHVAHWLGFEWQAGPAIVTSKGAAWGIVEVWAADPAEGRRVIEHAAAIAGVDLTGPDHAWVDSTARGNRYGQPGTMRVEHDMDGTPCISKRVGPSGTPSWMRDP